MGKQQNYINSKGELGHNLRLIRKRRELKQQDIANKLGVDRSTYSYYELGKSSPDIFTLIKLSEIFDTDIQCFLFKH